MDIVPRFYALLRRGCSSSAPAKLPRPVRGCAPPCRLADGEPAGRAVHHRRSGADPRGGVGRQRRPDAVPDPQRRHGGPDIGRLHRRLPGQPGSADRGDAGAHRLAQGQLLQRRHRQHVVAGQVCQAVWRADGLRRGRVLRHQAQQRLRRRRRGRTDDGLRGRVPHHRSGRLPVLDDRHQRAVRDRAADAGACAAVGSWRRCPVAPRRRAPPARPPRRPAPRPAARLRVCRFQRRPPGATSPNLLAAGSSNNFASSPWALKDQATITPDCGIDSSGDATSRRQFSSGSNGGDFCQAVSSSRHAAGSVTCSFYVESNTGQPWTVCCCDHVASASGSVPVGTTESRVSFPAEAVNPVTGATADSLQIHNASIDASISRAQMEAGSTPSGHVAT